MNIEETADNLWSGFNCSNQNCIHIISHMLYPPILSFMSYNRLIQWFIFVFPFFLLLTAASAGSAAKSGDSSSISSTSATSTASNANSNLMSKALSGFGAAKPKSNPLAAAVLATAASEAAKLEEQRQQQQQAAESRAAAGTPTTFTFRQNFGSYFDSFSWCWYQSWWFMDSSQFFPPSKNPPTQC